jgi:hypothetical protein
VKVALLLLLCAFLVALPGLVTACELRCASVPSVSHSRPVPVRHCGGHTESQTSDSPSSRPEPHHQDCGGHARLIQVTVPSAESWGACFTFPPSAPIPASPELVAGLTRLPKPASSPPLARKSGVLRL